MGSSSGDTAECKTGGTPSSLVGRQKRSRPFGRGAQTCRTRSGRRHFVSRRNGSPTDGGRRYRRQELGNPMTERGTSHRLAKLTASAAAPDIRTILEIVAGLGVDPSDPGAAVLRKCGAGGADRSFPP